MELDKKLNDYLEKVEKYLKPMAVSERVDIVREIKSEMLELQSQGTGTEQILQRLGDPRALAKAYLGACIARSPFGWRKLSAVIAFYSLAGSVGMIVLPVTGICGAAFMLSGVLCAIAGVVKFGAHLMGFELDAIGIHMGPVSVSAAAFLPLAVLIGAVLFAAGWLLWKLTLRIIRSLSRCKKKLDV